MVGRAFEEAFPRFPEVPEGFAYLAVKPLGCLGRSGSPEAGRVTRSKGCPSECRYRVVELGFCLDGFGDFSSRAEFQFECVRPVFESVLFEGEGCPGGLRRGVRDCNQEGVMVGHRSKVLGD